MGSMVMESGVCYYIRIYGVDSWRMIQANRISVFEENISMPIVNDVGYAIGILLEGINQILVRRLQSLL